MPFEVEKNLSAFFLLYHFTPSQELQDASRLLSAPLGFKIKSALECSCTVRFHQSVLLNAFQWWATG